MSISKHAIKAALSDWIAGENSTHGYWITVDALHVDKKKPDALQFEQTVGKFTNRLNNFCYGRAYRRHEKRLKIFGAVEIGNFTDRPHAHLLVLHDGDVQRGFHEVERKARDAWYELVGARGNIYSNLVDVQPIGDARSRLQYAIKQFDPHNDKYCHLLAL